MPAKPRLGPAEAPAPMVPSDARLARRDRSASAVATRVCVLHPVATTTPDPHSKTPLEAPLVDRGAGIIRPLRRGVRNFFFGRNALRGPSRFSAELARLAETSGRRRHGPATDWRF